MKVKYLGMALLLVLALSLLGAAATSAQGGGATLIVINYFGPDLIFTVDQVAHTVPGTSTAPDGGRVKLSLDPGRHTYSAHIGGIDDANGEVVLAAGETQILGARLDRTPAKLAPDGKVLEEPRDKVLIFNASLTPSAPTPTPALSLLPIPSGKGALILFNYIGDTLSIDIAGSKYSVPANGYLQVNLPPGEIVYSAAAAASGMNGTVRVSAGAYTGIGFTREIKPEEPKYKEGEPKPTPVPLKMFASPVTVEVIPIVTATQAPPMPTGTSTTTGAVPEGSAKITLVNYIGETLTFTINNQQYWVAGGGGKQEIELAPGDYTFTASIPKSAVNGSLKLDYGQSIRISAALNLATGEVQLYLE